MPSLSRAAVAMIITCLAICGVAIVGRGFGRDGTAELENNVQPDELEHSSVRLPSQANSLPTHADAGALPVREISPSQLETRLYQEITRTVSEFEVPMDGCDVSCFRDGSCVASLVFQNGTNAQLVGRIPTNRRMGGEFVETRDEPDGTVVVVVRFGDSKFYGNGE